jgi:hypothetical protein
VQTALVTFCLDIFFGLRVIAGAPPSTNWNAHSSDDSDPCLRRVLAVGPYTQEIAVYALPLTSRGDGLFIGVS